MPILDVTDISPSAFSQNPSSPGARRCDDPVFIDFCQALSSRLLRDPECRKFPDVMTFGYFCRKSSISKVFDSLPNSRLRMGWGSVIHIAPSNIPVNFAFSFLMGFLSGNANFVRVPSRTFRQVDLIVKAIDAVLADDDFSMLRGSITFFTCERDHPALANMVRRADGLIVWGGDATVAGFRAMEKRASAVELYFPDRVSSAVFSADAVIALEDKALTKLCDRFFNDTFLTDQNACSSPGILFWAGHSKMLAMAKNRFWTCFGARLAKKYLIEPTRMMDKHLDVMAMVNAVERPVEIASQDDIAWRFKDSDLGSAKLRYGNFLEVDIASIEEIAPHLRPNEQTITQFGFVSRDIFNALAETGRMVDRIVPVGEALSMSMQWDGKQVVSLLSRQIELA
jgi:hypothetical protein